jgi:hypothetical protein
MQKEREGLSGIPFRRRVRVFRWYTIQGRVWVCTYTIHEEKEGEGVLMEYNSGGG